MDDENTPPEIITLSPETITDIFAPVLVVEGAPDEVAELPALEEDTFDLPALQEIAFEEVPAALPAWLTAFLAGERITITPENVGLFTEFADAQADMDSAYYTHPAVVGSGLMAGDLFDFVQT